MLHYQLTGDTNTTHVSGGRYVTYRTCVGRRYVIVRYPRDIIVEVPNTINFSKTWNMLNICCKRYFATCLCRMYYANTMDRHFKQTKPCNDNVYCENNISLTILSSRQEIMAMYSIDRSISTNCNREFKCLLS